MAPPGFLRDAQQLLHEHKALLIADEVQTGIGRTGDFFAFEHDGVEPDLVADGQGALRRVRPGRRDDRPRLDLAEGLLVDGPRAGARLDVRVELAGDGGRASPRCTSIEAEDVVGNARRVGDALRARLAELQGSYDFIADVRGRGLMIGIEFGRPSSLKLRAGWTALQAARKGLFAQTVVNALFHKHRILTQVSGDHLEVIKLIPPLTIGEREVDRFVEGFVDVMDEAARGNGLVWQFGKTLIKQARAN